MARDTFTRYMWLVDVLRRYGKITRRKINELWEKSELSGGDPLPRRSFHNYRIGAEELFGIEIKCDKTTFEYYIDGYDDNRREGVADWLLNTAATSEALSHSSDVADRIIVEDVPSAREYLAPVIEALRSNSYIEFDYHPYTRNTPTRGIRLAPLFLKIFKQRWYVTGMNKADRRIKTYALDRIIRLHLLPETFEPDPTFDARDYTRHSFGVVFGEGQVKTVTLRVSARQAKYFRALPLHPTQSETVSDDFSIFSYRLKITSDLISEILSYGSKVTVLSPRELKLAVKNELQVTLNNYNTD